LESTTTRCSGALDGVFQGGMHGDDDDDVMMYILAVAKMKTFEPFL
jgi:hypothetical protein